MRETHELQITAPTRLLRGQNGYTLIEIIMVIVILGVIGGFTFQMVGAGVQAFKKSSARKDLSDQGRLALERMVRELRDGKEITDCSSNSITFKKAHPAQAADNIEEVKFELVGTDLKRVGDPNGNEGGPYPAVLASNVTSFQVGDAGGASSLAVDNASSGTTASDTASSMTVSHTTGSGSDRLMLVGISYNNDDYETVTGVTYNGTALTEVGTENNADDARVCIYSLVAPDTGTHNVVINFSDALNQGAIAGVVTFTGVDQSTPLGTFVSAQEDDSTPATVNIPSDSGELVFGVASAEYEAFTAATSGQNEHWRRSISGADTNGAGGTDAGASPTVPMSWSLDPSYNHWAIGGVSIKPSGSTGSTVCSSGTGSIGLDNVSTDVGSGNPLTFTHTIGGGTNRLLVVGISAECNEGITVSSVTYNGQGLTKAASVVADTGTVGTADLWYLLEADLPAAGTYNVEVTTSGYAVKSVGAISLEGVAQQAPEASTTNTNVGPDYISTSITTLTDGAWVVDVVENGNPNSFTPDGGQTERYDVVASSSDGAASTKEMATAGSTSMGWSSSANRLAHVVAAFAPAAASSPLVPLSLTMSSSEGGSVTMRTKVYMRNVPETGG
jgi:prepilin-type N-terminal cleavage/methylation domain-containing protein